MKVFGILAQVLSVTCSLDVDLKSDQAQVFQFESQVNQVMDIIIHSLYKTKDVFLRELISNSADALDKLRLESLKNSSIQDASDLKISISIHDNHLTIRDTGIGMTHEQLKNNLGTIAKSGTAEFLKTIKETDLSDPGLIGKFGVGFYSAFLVADSIQVTSKNNNDDQYIWESHSQTDFTILKDPRGNTLGRGTEITLTLKEDAKEFLDTDKLREIIKKHSEFVNFPVYLLSEKRTLVHDAEEDKLEEIETGDEMKVEDVKEEKEAKEPVYETFSEWDLVNENKPIWKRDSSELTKEDYLTFYKTYYNENTEPLSYAHFKLSGEAEFSCLIFVPSYAPKDFMQPEYDPKSVVQLFVKRVLISEDLHDFLPKYLSFIKIIIDSDDLPLNVNRESLQTHTSLKQIKMKLISKILDMFIEYSKEETVEGGKGYKDFYRDFGKGIKYGIYESKTTHQKKLIDLLRVRTNNDSFTSLEAYVTRMKSGQPQIYFSDSETSPFVEKLVDLGYEVIYFVDPFEEFLFRDHVKEYQKLPFQDVNKSGLKYAEEEEIDKEEEAELKKKFMPLTKFLLTKLEKDVSEVRLSSHLTSAPCAVVPEQFGVTASQQRTILARKAAGMEDHMAMFHLNQKRHFEINPKHVLMKKMLDLVLLQDKKRLEFIPQVLFDTYSIGSGWEVTKPKQFTKRVEDLIPSVVGVEIEAEVVVEEKQDDEKPPPIVINMDDDGNIQGIQGDETKSEEILGEDHQEL